MKTSLLIVALLISGCSMWDVINPFSNKGLDVETEIVVGDKKEEIATEVVGKKQTTNNTAETVNNTTTSYQTTSSPPFWIILLLVLGWVLPTPLQMYRWISSKVKGGFNGKKR